MKNKTILDNYIRKIYDSCFINWTDDSPSILGYLYDYLVKFDSYEE